MCFYRQCCSKASTMKTFFATGPCEGFSLCLILAMWKKSTAHVSTITWLPSATQLHPSPVYQRFFTCISLHGIFEAELCSCACARSSESGIAELTSWWSATERGVSCVDTCSMSYKGAGMSTDVMNTGASGVPLVEGCFSRCVTKVGMMDFCGAVRLSEHLHGDNAALVISPHHFGIVRWSPTMSTLGIKSISSTGSVFSPCLPGARCCFILGFARRV